MSFETRKFRDIEVVVNTSDPDRAINLTKLASTLTGSRQAFRDIIRDNKAFFELIDSYISSLEDQSLMGGNPPVNIQASRVRNLKWLVNEGILVEKLGKPNWNAGVYGPTYLADWIVINCCPKFFKQIHELFEIVDRFANLKNSTFSGEINSIISQKDREIERITGQRDDIIKQFEDFRNESREREERLIQQNVQTHEQLAQATNQIENLAQTTDGLRTLVIQNTEYTSRRLDELTTQINEVIPNSKITRGAAKELLIILRRPSLEKEMRELELINENENIFDTISCQAKDKNARLSDHNFNKDNDEIVLELESSNSIDLSYFAKIDLQDGRARLFSNSRFIRKLVFNKDFEHELIRRLSLYANSATDIRIAFIQAIRESQAELRRETREGLKRLNQRIEENVIEIHRVETRVEEVEDRITALEQLVMLAINKLSIPLSGRNRRLKLYLGKDNLPFVNINKLRHYLTEDEARYAIEHM